MGTPARSRRRRRGHGRRDAAAGRRRALRDLHGDRDRHPGDRRADARPQLPARDRRRLEPRRGAHRDRRLGARRGRLGLAEGHVHAARALVRERLAGRLGAQPRDLDAALLLRLEAHARRAERRRQPVHAGDLHRERARRGARPRPAEGLEAIWERTRGARRALPGARAGIRARALLARRRVVLARDRDQGAGGRRRRRVAARGARRAATSSRAAAAVLPARCCASGTWARPTRPRSTPDSTRCWPRCRNEPTPLRRRRADRRDRPGAAARGLRRGRARARRRSARGAGRRGRAGRALGHARRRRADRGRAQAARDRARGRRGRQRGRGRGHDARASSSATPRRRTSSRRPSTRSHCCSPWPAT